jgi:hypothetical protein
MRKLSQADVASTLFKASLNGRGISEIRVKASSKAHSSAHFDVGDSLRDSVAGQNQSGERPHLPCSIQNVSGVSISFSGWSPNHLGVSQYHPDESQYVFGDSPHEPGSFQNQTAPL